MKCRYTFKVRSNVLLDPPLRFSHDGWSFSLENENGSFHRLVIEIGSVQFTEYPRVNTPPGTKIPHITIPTDPMLDKVQEEVRAIRGALSLWGIDDIKADNPKCDWIPETEIERDSTHVMGFAMDRKPATPHAAPETLNLIARSVAARKRFIPHEIPLEFHRRGNEDMHHDRFIEAVYDFYFVLEYCFGDGKFGQKEVAKAFRRSSICRAAIQEAQNDTLRNVMEKALTRETFINKYRNKSVEEVIETITGLRGYLHHQSLTRKQNWNPGLPADFEVDASFLQRVSFEVVSNLATGILFSENVMTEFLATPIFGPANTRINWKPASIDPFVIGPRVQNHCLSAQSEDPDSILKIEDYEIPRTLGEFSGWWELKYNLFAATKAGRAYAREGKGLSKRFHDEAQVMLAAMRRFPPAANVRCKLQAGYEKADCVYLDPSDAVVRKFQVTTAVDGRTEKLRRRQLTRDGHVDGLAKLNENDEIPNDAPARDRYAAIKEVVTYILDTIGRKNGKGYEPDVTLVVGFDDSTYCDAEDLRQFEMHIGQPTHQFAEIYVVGVLGNIAIRIGGTDTKTDTNRVKNGIPG